MKNLFNKITKNVILPLAVVGGIYSSGYAQTKPDTTKEISSIMDHYYAGIELDVFQTIAVDNFNNAKIDFKECVEREKNDIPCFDSLEWNLLIPKAALENYISLFEKIKFHEDSVMKITYGRDLSINEAKEFLENERLIVKYTRDFLNAPSEEKEKVLVNHFDYTIKRANSYFPEEGVLDFSDILKD